MTAVTSPGVRATLNLREAVQLTRGGSTVGLAELYRRFAGELLVLARFLTGSREDAEDVVHDVFVGLPEALRHYDERGTFDAWIRRLVARAALASLRRSRRIERHATRLANSEAQPGLVDPPAGDDVWAAVARLPESLRATVVLRHIADLTHDESARVLGISPGAARVRYTRALRLLREALEDDR